MDLYFKGHLKLRIIVIYLHVNPLDKPYHIKLQQQLYDLITSNINVFYYIIMIEDFNTNLEHFYNYFSSTSKSK